MAGNDLGSLLGGLLGGGQGGGASGASGGAGGAGNILGSLLGALGGGQGGSGGSANALEGLIGMLTRSGLVDQAQSWVGTGANHAVSGAQIAEALPDETLKRVARETGVSTERAADVIARSLPTAVDRLTPTGEVPEGRSLEELVREQQL
ncbi:MULTISPECIES: YidB family protein [unclassified Streptomyces]|uniref:YidB family protein n=1 Tax=unclassified Streptomyces TaxID=2593676 RepID=UPI0022522B1C|nr:MULTISPECIES: YidB family protein [unclassified Streptomyces]WSP54271.1 YidB family protein [Streptomyces sp. NBC_01241]WSU25054.1 YidB family protein [Streptomyces sp. NBC_01108]MCX4785786.1 YidB family protein [Streptomyces sp. NBC_01221]MCX4798355.1 YidB family protein [Streptomyces sp. NBC_01242]WSJ39589.1 YidB family protein [Streptomyces sp. NBC_01321]